MARASVLAQSLCQSFAASGDTQKFEKCFFESYARITAAAGRTARDLFKDDAYGKISAICKENMSTCIKKRIEASIVELLTPGSSGSGVVIGDNGKTLLIATAKHVTETISGHEAIQVSYRNKTIGSVSQSEIWKHPTLDLALIRFKTETPAAVAYIYGLPYTTNNLAARIDQARGANSSLQTGQQIFVAGYSIQTPNIPPMLRVSRGDLISASTPSSDNDGYSLAYTAPTTTGMSGGGVFFTSYCLPPPGLESYHPMFGQVPAPIVIGLHGRAEKTDTKGFTGFNIAVPIAAIMDAKPGKEFFNIKRFRKFFCPYGTSTAPMRFN